MSSRFAIFEKNFKVSILHLSDFFEFKSKFGLSDTNQQRGRQTPSNRSQISQNRISTQTLETLRLSKAGAALVNTISSLVCVFKE